MYDCDFNATMMKAVEQIFGHRTRHTPRQGAAISSMLCESTIGSLNSMAIPRFKIWLVLREGLSQEGGLHLLKAKLDSIEDWLKSRQLLVSFHLIDLEDKSLTQDELVMSTPMTVLRERLYREAFYFGGTDGIHYGRLVADRNRRSVAVEKKIP